MLGFLLSLAVLHQVQCRPADQAVSAGSDKLHLFVANTSSSSDYHLGPILSEIENIEDEINADMQALMPFLNFMFDTDSVSDDKDSSCDDQMILQLVPDHNPTIYNPELQDNPLDVPEESLLENKPEAAESYEAGESENPTAEAKPEIVSTNDEEPESAVEKLNPAESGAVGPVVEQL
ncbi:uncharacterized protein LOC111001168 [Pieris rapae]|uniref:uncharacterized protein LOC111001168 n=1 Tax=Pieris rapae TaxID=64459 RepID=UPI001E27C8CD|nr:uncharacterized protein LOC111001168 [Pieris rapae]